MNTADKVIMYEFAALRCRLVNATSKARLLLAKPLLRRSKMVNKRKPDVLALILFFHLCLGGLDAQAGVKFHLNQEDRRFIYTEFIDDYGDTNSNVLRKYKVYKPKSLLPEYSDFGDGIAIWVNDNAPSQDDIHFKVKTLEANLDAMFERSALTQKNLLRVSNQAGTNSAYGFTLGLVVDTHYASSVEPGSIFHSYGIAAHSHGIAAVAVPLDPHKANRKGFSNLAPRGEGSASMVVVSDKLFTSYLDSDTPLLKPASPQRKTYEQVMSQRVLPTNSVESHHQMEILESNADGSKIAVAYDPVDGATVNVTQLERLNVTESDTLRETIYHESSHVYTISEGRAPPSMLNRQVSSFPGIVEELDTVGYTIGSTKGDFTEFHYKTEQSIRRGRFMPPVQYYGPESLLDILKRWGYYEPASYEAWEFSGGALNPEYQRSIIRSRTSRCG